MYSQCLARKQEVKQIIKSKADKNRAWEQTKGTCKKQNSTQRLSDLRALSIAPLRLHLSLFYPLLFKRTPSEAPKYYNVPSKSLCDPNICSVGSVLSLLIVLDDIAERRRIVRHTQQTERRMKHVAGGRIPRGSEPTSKRARNDNSFVPSCTIIMIGLTDCITCKSLRIVLATLRPPMPCQIMAVGSFMINAQSKFLGLRSM